MTHITTNEDTLSYPISTRLLMQEALRKGYELSYFPASPMVGTGIARAVKKDREIYFKSTSPLATPYMGYLAAEDKVLTYSLLSSRSINMPFSEVLSYDDPVEGVKYLLNEYGPVVVKPVAMNHGDGVTIGVKDETGLEKAVRYAREAAKGEMDVIVQQQVEGQEFRFLVVDGKVAAIASRLAPYVIGDGAHTIEELIGEKNKDPRRSNEHTSELTLISMDEVRTVKGEAFLGLVPEKGQKEEVLHTSNLSRGGEAVDYTEKASSALKKLAIDAARGCFLSVAGVDIITKDIGAETVDDSYVIEINKEPGIRMHQFPSVGEKRDVAKAIFKAFEKNARPIDKSVKVVGRSEKVKLPFFSDESIFARIDTGAVISALWASGIKEVNDGLEFELFDATSPVYTGKKLFVTNFSKRMVASSMGHTEERYVIKTTVQMKGKMINARFTLANRSTQTYPILIGRNVLRNNFVVDVFRGKADRNQEKARRQALEARYKETEQ
jgi:D-alanine-D-alanine ligase-like ATP-grasp enzyme